MKINLRTLNRRNVKDVQLFYSNLPLAETTLELQGNFYNFSATQATALAYLPKSISTVILSGNYVCTSSRSRNNVAATGDYDEYTTYYRVEIGKALPQYTAQLPDSVKTLRLCFTHVAYEVDVDYYSIDALIKAVSILPASIESLDLSGMDFSQGYSFRQVLTSLPRTIKTVSLSMPNTLQWALSSMSDAVTRLNLRGNQLGIHYNGRAFIEDGLAHLSHLEWLDLGHNELYRWSSDLWQAFMTNLPPRLSVLGLSNMSASAQSVTIAAFTHALSMMPSTINELDIGDNGFFRLQANHFGTFQLMLASIPDTVKRLRLCDKDWPARNISLLGAQLQLLPWHIETILLSDSDFSQLPANEFISALSSLPSTVHTLDLSNTHLNNKTSDELTLLFAGIPRHIRCLKLNDNGLIGMGLDGLANALNALPATLKEITLSGNGLSGLSRVQLHQLFDRLLITHQRITLDEHQFGIRHGALIHCATAQQSLFKPQKEFQFQPQFATLRLVMMQLSQCSHLPEDVIGMILLYLFDALPADICRMQKQMTTTLISPKPPEVITNTIEQASITAIRQRIAILTPGATQLDLSRCGLNRIRDNDALRTELRRIPNTVTAVNVRGNGFQHRDDDPLWRSQFFQTLGEELQLKTNISYLDLSHNGLDDLSYDELYTLLSYLPATIQYLSLGDEKPVNPRHQLTRAYWKSSFDSLTAHLQDPIQKAHLLLDDYTKGDSLFWRIITGHWHRHHTDRIAHIVQRIDKGTILNTVDLVDVLDEIKLENEGGSLASRLSFLRQISTTSMTQAQSVFEDENQEATNMLGESIELSNVR